MDYPIKGEQNSFVKQFFKSPSFHRKSKYANCLPEKFFENRDSILRNSDVVHINTLHNFAIALFFGIFGYNLVHNYVKNGEFNFGPNYLTNGFAKFHFVLIVWLWSFLVHLLTYPVFKYWANQRIVSGIPSGIFNVLKKFIA